MEHNRRDFLKQAAAGAAVTGIGGLGFSSTEAEEGVATSWDAGITGDHERKRLIAEARFGRKSLAESTRGMAICSHPLATREAVKVLRRGGNACDAALCASITQTVIEPHMTGITGVFAMLYFDAASGETTCVDAGWAAPKVPLENAVQEDMKTGRAVAVPGWWAGFQASVDRHGSREIAEIMEPAIRYARYGFEIHPFLWGEMFVTCPKLGLTDQGREAFMPRRALLDPGEKLYQRRSAETLERLAAEGNEYFYRGRFAEEHCRVVRAAGSTMIPDDFAAYEASWIEPQWGGYRGYRVASGGRFIVDALASIAELDLVKLGPPTDSAETFSELLRITTNFGQRSEDGEEEALVLAALLARTPDGPVPGSCHITVVDGAGNVASILHTSNALPWQNGLFANGVSICSGGGYLALMPPEALGAFTMAGIPSIIFADDKPVLASGSPSISLFPNIIQNTTNILDFGIPIEDSVVRPRFGGWSYDVQGTTVIETDFNPSIRKAAEEKGVRFDVVNPWNWHCGSFEGIHIVPETGLMRACGDPRRCSKAEGV